MKSNERTPRNAGNIRASKKPGTVHLNATARLIEAFAKLTPEGQVMVAGLALIVGGNYLLIARPF